MGGGHGGHLSLGSHCKNEGGRNRQKYLSRAVRYSGVWNAAAMSLAQGLSLSSVYSPPPRSGSGVGLSRATASVSLRPEEMAKLPLIRANSASSRVRGNWAASMG